MTRRARSTQSVLQVDGLPVHVTRKAIKRVNLRVKPATPADAPAYFRVEVSAPLRTADAFIAAFVREKRAWIDSQAVALADSPQARAAAATPAEIAEWRGVVEAFVPALVERWAPIVGVKAGKLAYRNMTSRWGSCQPSTGRICINVRLALYPPECLEYVVVHELCHLRERGHGERFQRLMDALLPDWRERRAKLRRS